MKRISILMMLFLAAEFVSAQEPVQWSFTAKKIKPNVYEVHITSTIQKPWHIYSLSSPEATGIPTKINFKKHPLVVLDGAAKELGTLITKHDDLFDADVKYFENKVDFVQVVTLKSDVKTLVNGTLEFMACNDGKCLPPKTVEFTVKIE